GRDGGPGSAPAGALDRSRGQRTRGAHGLDRLHGPDHVDSTEHARAADDLRLVRAPGPARRTAPRGDRVRRALAAALLVFVSSQHIAAQAPLTLEAAQAEARAHAPDVAALDAAVRGAEAVAAQAQRRLRQNPEVSGSIGPGAWVGR